MEADQMMAEFANRKLPPVVPEIQNMVSTVSLGCPIDLKLVSVHVRNAEYNPKRFAAVILRLRDPKATALVFPSGKIVVTGAKSVYTSVVSARKFARMIQKLGFPVAFLDFQIQNIVSSVDLGFSVSFEELTYAHSHFAYYDEGLFPALIYRMPHPRVVFLIFQNGRIIVTGAKTLEETDEAWNSIYPILCEFRKDATL